MNAIDLLIIILITIAVAALTYWLLIKAGLPNPGAIILTIVIAVLILYVLSRSDIRVGKTRLGLSPNPITNLMQPGVSLCTGFHGVFLDHFLADRANSITVCPYHTVA